MPVPYDARPLGHALERAHRDGLRHEEALLRALELVTLERGSDAAKDLLSEIRAILSGNTHGFAVPDLELAIARELVEKLVAKSPGRRLARISASNRLRGPAVGEAILERARATLPADAKDSGSWAACAVHAMNLSDTNDPREARHIASCSARALAFWGNSLRIQCDLHGAAELLREADRTIEAHGIGDLATRAEVASFRGSALRAKREFDQAVAAFECSKAGWQLLGRPNEEARIALKLSFTHSLRGCLEEALASLRTGRELLGTGEDNRLSWSFLHNEAWVLEELRDSVKSRQVADEARQLAAEFPDSFTQLRVEWLEGRLCRSEGRPDEAIGHFRTVQTGFLADRNPYDAALVSLDLAALYLETGRHAEVVELALAMRAAFEALGVHREALAAWRLFTDACQRQAASAKLAKNLARYLDQARHDPEFGFAASGVWG